MEFDPRSADRLPFHDPDEAEQVHAGATEPSRDAQRRHLQRVPLFSGFTEDELRRVAELSRIVEAPVGTVITQIGDAGDSSLRASATTLTRPSRSPIARARPLAAKREVPLVTSRLSARHSCSVFLCRRLLGWPASASGRLCHGDGGHEGGDCRRSVLKLPTLYRSLAPSLALIGHLIDGVAGGTTGPVSCAAVARADLV